MLNKLMILLFLSGFFFAEDTLTWEECVKEAVKNNPDLKSAKEKIFQAEKDLLVIQSGGVLQVSGSISQSNSFPLTSGTYSMSSGYSLSGRYLLYDGNKYSFDVAAAKERINAAKFSYEAVSASVRYSLRSAFLDLFKTGQLVIITGDIKKRRKENYDMVKLSYDAGREHKGSVLLAEANLLQADYEVTAAKRNLDLASTKLIGHLGRKNEATIKAVSEIDLKYDQKEKPDLKKLVENCPSYKQSLSQKFIADYNLKSARTSFFPQVSLSAGAGKNASNFAWDIPDLSAGISVSLDLFDGGRRTAQVEKAASLILQADFDLIASSFDLEAALFNSWINFQNASDQAGVRKKFLEATTERAKIAEIQYSNGLIAFDNWIIIEDDLVNSKKSLLDAQINSLSAENSWLNAKGETLESK
ncbi:MAG: hypothetical protein A2452_10725 [Candidatus Firestonebacteria bacterium RIFOXYC2_FULL_39_67]|nr:MAG: hypothetical protein A2536_01240 [Candidatus Firestonebacteria bacterium RIFOXYD2_FULL_39_29]OGF54166.1 MAG: hypothetical protein A2452_10725 [Candidatus Firestonebacteria bacterium RIFOXYC2_FULL_39_67]OGF57197.1 MAG: hypothetical protein A2497_05095 [Candidatus Firestonebacteria bacterium RifOxyC12_full_39_7]